VAIGSQCCIDRALFSTFTALGAETMLDNLVHVAHDVSIGARCTLTASSELSGGAVMEDDVWYAPGSVCNQFVRFGRGALVGTGSVVVRNVDPFTLVRGNPARPAGQICLCRTKLSVGDEWVVRCPSCRREYAAPNGVLSPL
jgi:acyl-[acyl carrier protein]--UDP-N-acetylglucosamine O-acyltransferase